MVFGLIAGLLAKLILSGRDLGGIIATILVVIVGGNVGEWVSHKPTWPQGIRINMYSVFVVAWEAIILVGSYRLYAQGWGGLARKPVKAGMTVPRSFSETVREVE